MIQQAHIHQRQCPAQCFGQLPVCQTGTAVARRMIVRQDDRYGMLAQRGLDDFTRIDPGLGQRTVRHFFYCQQAVPGIQTQQQHDLLHAHAVCQPQVVMYGLRAGQGIGYRQFFGEQPTCQFGHHSQFTGLGRPQPRTGHQLGHRTRQQPAQRPGLQQQLPGHIQHRLAGHAGTQQDGQQLGIRQCLRTARQQFFAWPLGGRPIGDFHEWIRIRWWPTD